MKKLLWQGLAGSGMMLLALCGNLDAEDRDYRYDRGNGYYRYDRGDGDYRRSPVERLRYDIDSIEASSRAWGRGRGGFERVRREIGDFERKWAAGRYDRRELDDVI